MPSWNPLKADFVSVVLLISLLSRAFPVDVHSLTSGSFVSQVHYCTPRRRQETRFLCASSIGEPEMVSSEGARKSFGQVLISIGPPCSNKRDALESFLFSEGYGQDERDGTVENAYRNINLQANSNGVYHRIPLAAFIYPTTRLTEKIGSETLHSDVTVRDRLFDPAFDQTDTEIRNVILRLAGRITPDEFAERVRTQALQAGDTVEYFRTRRMAITEDLINAMEEVVVEAIGEVLVQMQLKLDQAAAQAEELPYGDERDEQESAVDLSSINATSAHLLSARALVKTPDVALYVPQCIFDGGIDRAQDLLATLLIEESSEMPLAWDNTNTRPSEYISALAAAEKARRPVKFVSWGTQWMSRVSRKELLKRNIKRFRLTGRYIPAGAIGGALDRVETLVKMAEEKAQQTSLQQSGEDSGWEKHMDAAYASLGGYQMQEGGLVMKKGDCKQLKQPARNRQRKNNGYSTRRTQ